MIGTIDVKCHAASPQIPLRPLYAFAGSPSSVRLVDVPRKIGQWRITSVAVSVSYPDNRTVSRAATLVAGCWVATLDGCDTAGRTSGGFTVTASGTDEAGAEMRGYVLGRGDVVVLDGKETVSVGETTYHLRFFDTVPDAPQKGDMCVVGGALKWWDGAAWTLFGAGGDMSHSEFAALPSEDLDPEKVGFPEICDMVNKMKKALRPSAALLAAALPLFGWGASVQSARLVDLKGASPVVTNVSFSGLATTADVATALAPYAKRTEIPTVPTNVSALTNDAGYLTGETDPAFSRFMANGGTFGGYGEKLTNGLDLLKFWIDWTAPYSLKDILGNFVDRRWSAGVQSVDSRINANGGIYLPAWSMLWTGTGENRQGIEGLIDSKTAAATNGLASVSSVASVSSDLAAHASSTANPHKVTAAQAGAVPTSRKVNGKALSADVTLGAADVGAYTKAQTDAAISSATNGLASASSVASVSSALAAKADKSALSGYATTAALAAKADASALDAKQDRPAATATAAALSLRADGAAISVAVAASGTLSASLEGWTDGQAQTALISLAPGASVAAAVSLVGYGSWPTNRFVASCVRVGPRVYVTPITALDE